MSYAPLDRNASGIVFFGASSTDAVFESNSSFTFDGTNLVVPNIRLPNGGKIGSASQTGILTLGSDGIATFSSGVVIEGDLTVNGDVVTLNTTTLTVEDNIILLNKNVTGVPSLDAGLEVKRGTSANVRLFYDEGIDQWRFTNDGTTFYAIPTGVASTSFSFTGDSGTSQTLFSGDTITVAGGSGISTVAGATDTVTVHLNVDNSTVEINTDILRIKDAGVTAAKIATGAVGTTQLADSAVTDVKLAANAVTTAKILDSNVTNAKLATDSVTTIKIAGLAVTDAKLAADSVITAKIANLAVTDTKLAADSVTTAKIAGLAVTDAKLAADSVTTAKILNSNVTTAKIADSAVTEAKISRTVDSSFLTNDTIASDINLVAAGAGGITIKLPAPLAGKKVIVKKTDSAAGAVTISRNATDTIDGATSKLLYYQYEALTFVSDGTNWFIV
jgi:hypothetical protein